MKIAYWDRPKCPSNRGVRLIEVFLRERHLNSAETCKCVRLREVSVLWDVRLERFYCIRECNTYLNSSDLPFCWYKMFHQNSLSYSEEPLRLDRILRFFADDI